MASVKLSGLAVTLGRNGLKGSTQNHSNLLILSRGITGKTFRDPTDKPKSFPYESKNFNVFHSILDRTSHKFEENTKIIVVQGSHAVGKSKLAEELADEFEMKYMPQTSLEEAYKSPYGHFSISDYNEYLMPRCKTYDEKDFARDPWKVDGCIDRYVCYKYHLKFVQYFKALRHLFNTGQGVVLESNPFSHYVEIDALYNAGYIDKSSLAFYDRLLNGSHHYLLRPNLVVWLDAPVDVVQKKIKERGNEWDQNSPIWKDSSYLNDLYVSMKRDYLKTAQKHSQVLVYDWSEPGETEIVVEDIEALNFDHHGLYDLQQLDWRLYNEDICLYYRNRYSKVMEMESIFSKALRTMGDYDAEKIHLTAEEHINMQNLGEMLPGHDYEVGFNTSMGDSLWQILFNPSYTNLQRLNNGWWYPFHETRPGSTSRNKFDYAP